MEPVKVDPKEIGRMHSIFMVQSKIAGFDIWQNVKAFAQEESAKKFVKTCESISRKNVMRVEKEILIL